MKWRRKLILLTVCFFILFIATWPFLPSSIMAKDTDTEKSGPPADSTFEHVIIEPTNYAYTSIDPNTEQFEVAIMGEDCTNWRDLDQAGTGWPTPSNYNWHDQDIRAPFQFPHNPDDVTIMSVTVELRVFDIDAPSEFPPSPSEVDIVYLNDLNIGTLNGTHDTWMWNTFTPSIGTIVQGENHIDIDVDTEHTTKYWAMTVDWIKVTITYQVSTPPTQAVGGVWVPINKIELLAPWISLASFITVSAVSVIHVKRKKKQQS
ncbi:MAG: hypothetical protein OEW95_02620 [Candidatus Bathyarchaeota archaeon]|nr:hypothetical protein [Candidatus Bathyarchaeota archaeon]